MIPGPGDAALLSLTGIQVFRELPAGQELGGEIQIKGETFVVTRRELDRLKNLPTAEEARAYVDKFHELLNRRSTTMSDQKRRTKRRYAHELYPHGNEWEARPLEVELPYLYARAIGFDVQGTNWFTTDVKLAGARTAQLLDTRHIALLADAMHQGLTGQEAWNWAETRMDDAGEWIYERATHYGVDPGAIKPYACGPEPDHHDHHEPIPGSKWLKVNRAEGKESECAECAEPVK